MKESIKKISDNPLIAGAFFLFSGGMLSNFFNFIFNLFMSRNLKVEEYGVLISLISIITLLSIPAGAFTPTILTVAGKYFAQNDYSRLHGFYFKMIKPLVVLGAVLLIIFLIFSRFIGDFFHISNPFLLTISAFAIFLVYITTLSNTLLQAKLAFRALSFTSTLSTIIKVAFGIALVSLGFGLGGAVAGLFLSFLLPVLIGAIFLWKVIFFRGEKSVAITYKELLSYGIPSACIVFSLNAFITIDILLVKHLFSDLQAGQYAGLSLVGRVIFYLTAPIGTVMFPIIINRINTNKDYRKILFASLGLVGGISTFISIFYYAFPQFTIQFFLKKSEYLVVSPHLGSFGLFITVYSLVSLLAYYYLSIRKTFILWAMLLASLLQTVLIYLFHDNFADIIHISIGILILLLFYLLYNFRKVSK